MAMNAYQEAMKRALSREERERAQRQAQRSAPASFAAGPVPQRAYAEPAAPAGGAMPGSQQPQAAQERTRAFSAGNTPPSDRYQPRMEAQSGNTPVIGNQAVGFRSGMADADRAGRNAVGAGPGYPSGSGFYTPVSDEAKVLRGSNAARDQYAKLLEAVRNLTPEQLAVLRNARGSSAGRGNDQEPFEHDDRRLVIDGPVPRDDEEPVQYDGRGLILDGPLDEEPVPYDDRRLIRDGGGVDPDRNEDSEYLSRNLGAGYAGQSTGYTGQSAGSPYQAYLDQWSYGQAPEWQGSDYQAKRDEALRRAEDLRWDYDPETDPVWQAYRKQYRREGQRASQDAMGAYAALTGGVPSSYAATAATQAGDYYAAQLSDKLPELYRDAYDRYLQEFQRQLGISDQYADFDDREYSRYRDRLAQYNTDRSFEYGRYRDAVSDRRYDQEWAQKLLEYADSQNWKRKEWNQYLREYGDQLSERERQWVYQQARDALGDQREENQWQQYLREYEDKQRQQSISNAWKRVQTTGIVSEEDAAILGIPAGNYRGSGASGGTESGGPDSGDGQSTTSAPTDAQNGDDGKRSGSWKDADGYIYSGYHADRRWKTAGYDAARVELQSMVRSGAEQQLVLTVVKNMVSQKRITSYEAEMLLAELGYRGANAGNGRSASGPNNGQGGR